MKLTRVILMFFFSLTVVDVKSQNDSLKLTSIIFPSVPSEIIITKNTLIRTNINYTSDTSINYTKYNIYDRYKLRKHLFFATSGYSGHGYEIISFKLKSNQLISVAFTDVLNWGFVHKPERRQIKKNYLNDEKLPYLTLYTHEQVTEFKNYVPIEKATNSEIEKTLDTLIEIKRQYLSKIEQLRTLEKSVVYLYPEFISKALIKNKINPFYNEAFFQLIKKRPNAEGIITKTEKFFNKDTYE